jgi:hypothetical protein
LFDEIYFLITDEIKTMTKKFVEKPMFETKKAMVQLEKAVEVIAGLRLLHKRTKLSFEAETARIERCIEFFYKTQDFDEDFYEFGLNFIKELGSDMVNTTNYEDMYISDVLDI